MRQPIIKHHVITLPANDVVVHSVDELGLSSRVRQRYIPGRSGYLEEVNPDTIMSGTRGLINFAKWRAIQGLFFSFIVVVV
jgi:hypothetical protein